MPREYLAPTSCRVDAHAAHVRDCMLARARRWLPQRKMNVDDAFQFTALLLVAVGELAVRGVAHGVSGGLRAHAIL